MACLRMNQPGCVPFIPDFAVETQQSIRRLAPRHGFNSLEGMNRIIFENEEMIVAVNAIYAIA